MQEIKQQGRIVAPVGAHVFLNATMPRVYAIPSFDDYHSPKTQRDMRDALRAHAQRYVTESSYAGLVAGKRTYNVLVYSSREERAAVFAYIASKAETAG